MVSEETQNSAISGELEPIFSLNAPEIEPVSQTLSPSELGGSKALPGEAGLDEEAAKLRGSQIHALLEHLPNHPKDMWPEAATHILGTLDEARPDPSLLSEARAVLESEHLAAVFSADALVEVSITAHLGERRLHGTIDRLIVTNTHVLAVDFKTNAVVPKTPEQVPEGLMRQMAAYAHALEQIYPDRTIETALLWTRSCELMHLPQQLVNAAMQNVHAA